MRNAGRICKGAAKVLFCICVCAFLVVGVFAVVRFINGVETFGQMMKHLGVMLAGFLFSWFGFILFYTIGDLAETNRYIAEFYMKAERKQEAKTYNQYRER